MTALIKDISVVSVRGSCDTPINGLSYDSRETQKGDLFVSLHGLHTDGHRYIGDAVHNGAAAVVHQDELPAYPEHVVCIRVPDCRKALSRLAASFFDYPSEKLLTIGVTGTDGKSTTVWFIHQLLCAMGIDSGFLSTVALKAGDVTEKNRYRQSTPEAPEVHGILARMAASGKTHAVLEATSHGLSEKTGRLRDVSFDAAVLTNVAHEHLEFHGSFEQYRFDKANLFRSLDAPPSYKKRSPSDRYPFPGRFGVVNADDPSSRFFRNATKAPVYSYSLKDESADILASEISLRPDGSDFIIKGRGESTKTSLPVPGTFNIENALAAALTVAKLCGVTFGEVAGHFHRLTGVTGRMTAVDCGQPFSVIVDYAHTPQAFTKLFTMMRPLVEGRLIAVFGSAGERDIQKRPMQGSIASRYSDIVVLTDEDPRLEDRMRILEEIAEGCTGLTPGESLFLEPDREKAISLAFSLARPGDTVLLLGKGHEGSIIYPDGKLMWNEEETAKKILRLSGYGRE